MTKFLLAGAAMLSVSTAALADEPQKLSDDQMSVVAGGQPFNGPPFNGPPFNGNGTPSLPAFLLFVTTTEVTSTQTNAAASEQVGAALGLAGTASVIQASTINQQNN
jgi:hypothetical protein